MAPKRSKIVEKAPGDRSELHSEQELRRSSRIRKQVTDAPTPIKKPAKDSDINEPTTQKRIHRQQSVKTEKKLIKNVTVTMEKGKPPMDQALDLLEADPAPCDEACTIDRLPLEVFDYIVAYLSHHDRKNVRLVCKYWYERCNQDVHVHLRHRMAPVPDEYLKNCGFKHWNLHCRSYPANELITPVWKKLGTNLNSIEFFCCRLGDRVIENVILFCDNLKTLEVHLYNQDANTSFCSPEMLEGLNIVRSNLKKLKIGGWTMLEVSSEWCFETWKRIFEMLLRIFPKIDYFSTGRTTRRMGFDEDFCCIFEEQFSEIDRPRLAISMAYSVSASYENWRNAINALSQLRLTNFSLNFVKSMYMVEDSAVLLNFFARQNKLKSISLTYAEHVNIATFKKILFQIFNHCSEVRKLIYERRLCNYKRMGHYWIPYLTKTELSRFQSKLSSLEEMYFDGFEMKNSALVTNFSMTDHQILNPKFEQSLTCFIPKYIHLQRLSLSSKVSDEGFQTIFQYLTAVKILQVRLHASNTNFGMTGRRDDISTDGYSISRLQNLERLMIMWTHGCKITEEVYHDFDFPKLNHLYTLPPCNRSILIHMAKKMPCLRIIDFSMAYAIPTEDDLSHFCLNAKNLHSLKAILGKFSISKAKKIFGVDSTLKYLHCYSGTYYWDPFKKEVLFKGNTEEDRQRILKSKPKHPYRLFVK